MLWPSSWGLLWSRLLSNSFQINAVSSVSLTSAIVSSITVYQYKFAVSRVLVVNIYYSNSFHWEETHFVDKDAALRLTDQENTSVAISSLIAIVSTIEVALAVCAAWCSDSLYQPTQENQVSQVCDLSYGATRNNFHTMAQKILTDQNTRRCKLDGITPKFSIACCACVVLPVLTNIFSTNK